MLLSCQKSNLNEQEKSECEAYRLNPYDTWEVYNTDTTTAKTEPQKTNEPEPVLPVKKNEEVKVKVSEVEKSVIKSSVIQVNTTTPSTLEKNKMTTKNQPSFFAKIKNLLLSIWR